MGVREVWYLQCPGTHRRKPDRIRKYKRPYSRRPRCSLVPSFQLLLAPTTLSAAVLTQIAIYTTFLLHAK